MIPIIGDLLKNTVGKIVDKVVDKYLPPSMSEKEKAEMQLEISKILIDEEKTLQAQMETVNATMREEAKSEHWIVYSWRPLIGYTFIVTVLNNYVLLPYFINYGLQSIEIPSEIWSAMLIILGVSAGTRGIEKMWRTKNK